MLTFTIDENCDRADISVHNENSTLETASLNLDMRFMQADILLRAAASLLPEGGDSDPMIKKIRKIARDLHYGNY